MNVAEYLIKRLEALGVNDFFGLPGDYNFNILYAIENNENTNWIGCTNELNAGYAADGYAREKGYGAIVTTYGVGELSAINAIAGSYAENIPVINIVGLPSTKNLNDKILLHHNFNIINTKAYIKAYEQVVETTALLTKENAKLEIDRVLKTFVKEKRPVYIAIPMDVSLLEISDKEIDYNWISDKDVLEKVVNIINDKIKSSTNPVILGDVLVRRYDSYNEYKKMVEKSGIATTNFLMGSDLITDDVKNYIGTYYSDYRNLLAKKLLETTDCLIAVGTIYSDINSFGFKLPYEINSQVAIYGTHTYIEGEKYDNVKMADVLEKLTEIVEPRLFDAQKENLACKKAFITQNELTSEYIYPRLQEFFREDDIIISETGISSLGLAEAKLPKNAHFITQTLWGSIGWATPATLGVCLAKPNKRVVLITGEGSHQLTAMEIGTMLKYGIKPVIIVLNNSGYTIERVLSRSAEDKFNDIVPINYSKFARVFDGNIWSTRVQTADDFDKALKVTQIMDKLCYLEIFTDKLDLPKLSEEVFSDIKNKSNVEIDKNIAEKDVKLMEKKSLKFTTIVHESLYKDL
ncbi:MAG: alpha-keto acid decarboxylase family protein [Cyanobacteria bacterium SIG28]|nr:alpha-keto acid decarboxylase family protein [Cyanobacteria bacterium SIG28]